MNKAVTILSVLALMFACTPVENGSNVIDGPGTVHVTGVSLDKTSLTLKP